MITITENAVKHIQNIMQRHESPIGFRLSIKQTGCTGYMYVPEVISEEKPDDIKIAASQGLTIYLDPQCEKIVNGMEIDFVQKDLGMQQLVFNNPNVAGLCGCGESFHLDEEKADE